jgi:preprotein translocase subunit SecY
MFKTLKNAWKIHELRNKLLFTVLIVILYRLGANIPVPYVDPGTFKQASEIFGGTILQYLNILSGEALAKATLLALGVSPYITASIVMQLLTIAIPPLERLSKDGENGKRKITAITRVVTVALALITSIGYAFFLSNNDLLVVKPNFFQYAVIVACYCAGAALVMWLAEQINAHGIGNGISMILFANIVAGAPSMISSVWATATESKFKGVDPETSTNLIIGIILAVVVVLMFLAMLCS